MVDALFLDDGRKQDFGTGSSPVLTTKIKWTMQVRILKRRGERCTQPTVIQ